MATIYDLSKKKTATGTEKQYPTLVIEKADKGLSASQKVGMATAGTTAEKVAIATGKTTDVSLNANPPSVPPYQGGNSQTGGTNAAGVSNPSYVNQKSQRVFQYLENGAVNPEYDAGQRDDKYQIFNSPEQSSLVSNVSATETDFWQKQIDDANTRANAALAERDKIFKASMETLKKSEELQKAQYAALEAKIGAQNVPELKSIIGGIEAAAGSPVVLSENFIASAEKISAQFADDPEKRKRFLTELAENSLLKNKSPQEQAEWNAGVRTTPSTPSVSPFSGGGTGTGTPLSPPLSGGMEGVAPIVETEMPVIPQSIMNVNTANLGAIANELMRSPDAVSGEILAAQLQIGATNAASKRTEDFLMQLAADARASEKRNIEMLKSQSEESKKILQDAADLEEKKLELKKEALYAEKAVEVGKMEKKYANLEGFNKSLLKHLGLSGGTYEANALAVSTAKVMELIKNTESKYDVSIEEVDNKITEINLNLAANLVQISHQYTRDILAQEDKTEARLSELGLKALENANEREKTNASALGTFMQKVISAKEKANTAAEKAAKEAHEELQKEADRLTDALGVVYYTDADGGLSVILDENGNAVQTLAAEKLSLDIKKEEFDQKMKTIEIGLAQAKANRTMSNSAYTANMKAVQTMKEDQSKKIVMVNALKNGVSPLEFQNEIAAKLASTTKNERMDMVAEYTRFFNGAANDTDGSLDFSEEERRRIAEAQKRDQEGVKKKTEPTATELLEKWLGASSSQKKEEEKTEEEGWTL